jgi:hypothetical protein
VRACERWVEEKKEKFYENDDEDNPSVGGVVYRHHVHWAAVTWDPRACWPGCRGKGESICLVVGGAKESLAAEPGAYDLVLNSRKVPPLIISPRLSPPSLLPTLILSSSPVEPSIITPHPPRSVCIPEAFPQALSDFLTLLLAMSLGHASVVGSPPRGER